MGTVFNKSIKMIMIIFFISLIVLSISSNSYAAIKKIKSVTLNKSSASINVGNSVTLSATVKRYSLFASKKVSWSSSNNSIATVSSKGVVTGKNAGTVTITATSVADSSKKASCKITVSYATSSKQYTASVYEGMSVELGSKLFVPTIYSWRSTDDSIAKVILNGEICTVKGLKAGKVKINGYASINNLPVVTYILEVKKYIKVTSLSLDKTSVALYPGDALRLNVTINPSNATSKEITWSSNNKNIATVDSNGNIKAIKEGTVIITATHKDGMSKSCTVTVKNPYKRVYGENTYTIAVKRDVLSNVIISIDKYDIHQSVDKKDQGLRSKGGRCLYVAQYHRAMLLGYKLDLSKARTTIINNNICYTNNSKTINYSTIKTQIDKHNPVIIHVSNSTSSTHWVNVVGYKGNCSSFDDLLMLGTWSGSLLTGKTGEQNLRIA